MKKRIQNENQIEIVKNMMLGGMSTTVHDFIMTPAEMIKQRLQLTKNITTSKMIKSIY